MRSSRRLPVLVCLVWVLLGLGGAALARAAEAPVRLVAPEPGAVLTAGSLAELAWEPQAGFERLSPAVEEWEAFLSLDGGRTYPVRITPHLDQDLRRVRFQVPDLPSGDVRILLRLGNEREETPVEVPGRFTIAAAPMAGPADAVAFSRTSLERGEAALPGQAGVVAWVEGSRRGGSLRRVIAEARPGWETRFALPTSHREAAEVDSGRSLPDAGRDLAATISSLTYPEAPRRAAFRAGAGPGPSFDILLLTQRQNE